MNMKNTSLKLSTIALAIALASCGGGGGFYGDSSSGTGTGTGGTATGNAAVNATSIKLYDVNGMLTTIITSAGVTAKIKVTDAQGAAISGALVTFNSTGGVDFGTSNRSVVTDADGEASISVKPTDATSTGAYQISASVSYNGTTATAQSLNFSLQAANISFDNLVAQNPSITTGGSTTVTLKTVDVASGNPQNGITVNFSSTCGVLEPSSVVSSNQGDVTTNYKSIDASGNLCSGPQTITASSAVGTVNRTVGVTIAPIQASSIVYTSSSDVKLGVRKSGSASSGKIEFTVFANGSPAANQEVQIELTQSPDDLSFINPGNRDPITRKSDANGKISVDVYPGDIPGPVEIKATLANNSNIFAFTKNVAVQVGRATQDSFTLSATKYALNNTIDGDKTDITVFLADRTGNPVPNGTVVSFVAEGGKIASNCSTVDGDCTVSFQTQNPRPLDNRVTILAYVEGDKSYIDRNGNNVFDSGDTLKSNIGSFYRDDNENNRYDSDDGEFVYRTAQGNTSCASSSFEQPNNLDVTNLNTCTSTLSGVLRKQIVIAFSDTSPTLFGNTGVDRNLNITSNDFSIYLFGNNQGTVPLPSGTDITFSTKDNTPNNNLACTVSLVGGKSPVRDNVNLFNSNEALYSLRMTGCASTDNIVIDTNIDDDKNTITLDVLLP